VADNFANILYNSVVESSANTLTFDEITLGLSLFDKVALIINRIEWYAWPTRLLAAGDAIEFGISSSNAFVDPDSSQPSIITFQSMDVVDFGTAGVHEVWRQPLVEDLSNLPGGGLLITPRPLYQFVEGTNLAAVATVRMRMFFTVKKMKPEEYFELLETRTYFSA